MKKDPAMRTETVRLDEIHLDPANVRKHPERNLESIKASLARFGQQEFILIDSKNVVRAGNGRVIAARELGWTTMQAIRSDLQGIDLTAYSIASNRTAELAEWDDPALAETIRALQSEDFPLDAVGFTNDEINRLCDKIAGEITEDIESPEDFPEHDESIDTDYQCPKCSYRWSGKPA